MEHMTDMIKILLFLLSLWGVLFTVYRFGKVKIWFVPVTCAAGISLILFWGGLFGQLAPAADLVFLAGLAGSGVFLYCVIKGRIRFPAWSLFGVCFGTGVIVFVILTAYLRLDHYDNFSHWALIVKYLLTEDCFPGRDTTLIPFRDYPPGSSVFIYYVCRFAGHSQGAMLLAQNSMIFACFLAVFGVVKERRRFLLYSFLAMGCAFLSYLNLTIRINNLLVDFLLPLLALASVAAAYQYRDEKGKLCILEIILLGFTGIVKGTGMFFAGIAGLYVLWSMFRTEKLHMGKPRTEKPHVGRFRTEKYHTGKGGRIMKRFLYSLLTIAGGMLPFLAWQYHLRTDLAGFQGKFEIGDAPAPEFELAAEIFHESIVRDFLRTAFDPSTRAFQVFALCSLAAVTAVLCARLRLKRRWRLGQILLSAYMMTALYYAGMLYMYLYTMPEEEALRLAGSDRYACSIMVLFAGVLFMGAAVDIEHSFAVDIDERGAYRAYSSPGAKRRYQYAVLGTFLLAVNFLYSEINGLISIRQEWNASLPGQAEQIIGDRWYGKGTMDERRYLVAASDENGQVSDGEVRYVCRYYLWAEDVEVTDRLDEKVLEEAQENYDCIIILDPDAVQEGVTEIGGEKYPGRGIYRVKG